MPEEITVPRDKLDDELRKIRRAGGRRIIEVRTAPGNNCVITITQSEPRVEIR